SSTETSIRVSIEPVDGPSRSGVSLDVPSRRRYRTVARMSAAQRPGRYRVVVRTEDGRELSSVELTVSERGELTARSALQDPAVVLAGTTRRSSQDPRSRERRAEGRHARLDTGDGKRRPSGGRVPGEMSSSPSIAKSSLGHPERPPRLPRNAERSGATLGWTPGTGSADQSGAPLRSAARANARASK